MTATKSDGASAPQKPRYPIGSVDRVLQLLLLFRDRESIRVADAAAELGVASSTAHRLLAMLQLHGFVTQDSATRQYVCGPAVIELSHAVRANEEDITPLLQTAVEEAAERLDETANACVLHHTSVIFVAGRECDHPLRVADQTGRRIVAFHSAGGKVLLADLPVSRLRELYPNDPIEDPLVGVRVRRRDFEAELESVRADGFAVNSVGGKGMFEFQSVAVPVRRGTDTIAALTVAAPAQRVTKSWAKDAAATLRQVAASVEAAL
jgi:IclR family acetate operon transcriptional repressor